MILVIPSIQLINGECGDIISGITTNCSIYNEFRRNPKELIKLWRRENAKTIHINNIDSFQTSDNTKNLKNILEFSSLTDIPISLFHLYKDFDTCTKMLESGIYRIFAGTLLINNITDAKQLLKKYTTSRICGHLITDGKIAYFNNKNTQLPINEALDIYKEIGIHRILYNSLFSINEITLEDINQISKQVENYKFKITLNGGAIYPKDLWLLNENAAGGIDSIIVGRALYQNNFPCQKIWRLVEEELEPEIIRT